MGKKDGFISMPTALIMDPSFRPAYLKLWALIHASEQWSEPVDGLAKVLRVHRTRVCNILREMEIAGFVTRERRKGKPSIFKAVMPNK